MSSLTPLHCPALPSRLVGAVCQGWHGWRELQTQAKPSRASWCREASFLSTPSCPRGARTASIVASRQPRPCLCLTRPHCLSFTLKLLQVSHSVTWRGGRLPSQRLQPTVCASVVAAGWLAPRASSSSFWGHQPPARGWVKEQHWYERRLSTEEKKTVGGEMMSSNLQMAAIRPTSDSTPA